MFTLILDFTLRFLWQNFFLFSNIFLLLFQYFSKESYQYFNIFLTDFGTPTLHSVICFLNFLAPTWWRLAETSFCSLTMPKSDSYRLVTSALWFRCLFLSGLLCFFDFIHLVWYYTSDERQTRYRFVVILWIYVRAFSTVHWSNLRKWINAFVLVESFRCMP